MKLNKILICLIVCLVILSQVSARKTKAQKKSKVYLKTWGDWNQAQVQVIGKNNYLFKCKLRDVFQNNLPLGVEFDALEQLSENDRTGFIQFGQQLTQMTNQDIPRSMIDFRQVKNCLFTDNEKETFGAWRLEFDFNFNEEYGIKSTSEQTLGDALRIKITFPNAKKSQALGIKQNLVKNCEARNNQVTGLKKAAIDAGNLYHSLWFEYNNRQQSLEQQAQLIADAKKVVEQVRAEEASKAQDFQKQVVANEQLLQKSQELLNQAASKKQTNEQETEQISSSLNTIKSQLLQLETSQQLVKSNLVKSQTQLNAAIKLQQDQEAEKSKLEQSKQALQNQTLVEQKEYERLLQEIQERQKRMQQEYETKKNKLQEQANLLNNQSSQVSQAIAAQQKSVEGLKQLINQELEQIKSIDEQCSATKRSIGQMEEKINSKRNYTAQLNQQIQQQQQELKDREARNKQVQEDNAKQLESLKQKELAQINLVSNITAEQKKKLVYYAEQANKDIVSAQGNFTEALQRIVSAANKASFRTERAAKVVLQNQHVSELTAVVSSTQVQIKASLMRQARVQKQFNRLAKLRSQQVHYIRLQRNKLNRKLRQSLRHKLVRNKYI